MAAASHAANVGSEPTIMGGCTGFTLAPGPVVKSKIRANFMTATLVSGVLIGLSEALEHGKPKAKH